MLDFLARSNQENVMTLDQDAKSLLKHKYIKE